MEFLMLYSMEDCTGLWIERHKYTFHGSLGFTILLARALIISYAATLITIGLPQIIVYQNPTLGAKF